MSKQFLAELQLLRGNAVPDDEPGRGAAANMEDRKLPNA
jgi:hypothetical protein